MGRVWQALREAVTGRWARWILLAVWAVVAGVTVPAALDLHAIEDNQIRNYLPAAAQSTRVERLLTRFPAGRAATAVVVFARSGGLVPADRTRIEAARSALGRIGTAGPVIVARDGAAALFPLAFSDHPDQLAETVAHIRGVVRAKAGDLKTGVTGPAPFTVDASDALQGIDTELLLAAGTVVAVVLLVVYRSPVLWLLPLIATGAALITARAAVYALARYADLTVTGLATGVLDVLVFGAGTDYALLLIARYREELPRHPHRRLAMAKALRRAGPAIIASAATVILGLLCLLAATLNSDRGLGPVAATGIACMLIAALTLLPTLFLVCGPWVFWPYQPQAAPVDAPSSGTPTAGVWAAIGARLAQRPRLVWASVAVVLALAAGGLAGLRLGLPQAQGFISNVPAVAGEKLLSAHFPASAEAPLIVIADASSAAQVKAVVNGTPGVLLSHPAGQAGGLAELQVVLRDPPDSPAAHAAVGRLRDRLAGLSEAEALVGGSSAIELDIAAAAAHDRRVVMPMVLAVVAVVLGVLLRALMAPLVLIATVILSYAAALGMSSLVFAWAFGFVGIDQSVPLDTFIFLVALGIDYNIFLMTRARQEAARAGTRAGMHRALALTGGVITSAGCVLAATFAVLMLLPLVVMIEVGFIIAFGILLDTFIVRSILVPALVFDLGRRIWWPSARE